MSLYHAQDEGRTWSYICRALYHTWVSSFTFHYKTQHAIFLDKETILVLLGIQKKGWRLSLKISDKTSLEMVPNKLNYISRDHNILICNLTATYLSCGEFRQQAFTQASQKFVLFPESKVKRYLCCLVKSFCNPEPHAEINVRNVVRCLEANTYQPKDNQEHCHSL